MSGGMTRPQLYVVTLRSSIGVSGVRASGARAVATGCSLLMADPDSAAQLKQLHGVIDLKPALRVTLEFSGESEDLRVAVDRLGGVVLRVYKNAPLMSLAVPLDRISRLRFLPGVKQVRKSKKVTPAKSQ